jgi:hypothetical protein
MTVNLIHLYVFKLVEEGSNPEFLAYCADYKARLRREVEIAQKHQQWQMESTKQLCDYELKAAEEIFEFSKKELKSKMLDNIEEEIKRLESLREGILEEEAAKSKRSSRIKVKGEEAPKATTDALKKKPRVIGSALNWTLDEADIKADIVEITSDWISQSQKFKSKHTPVKCRFERGKLFVADNPFEKVNIVYIMMFMCKCVCMCKSALNVVYLHENISSLEIPSLRSPPPPLSSSLGVLHHYHLHCYKD